MSNVTLLFFTNNLRLHDNRALEYALSFKDPILPIVVNDKQRHQRTWFNWTSRGPFRHQFWFESIQDLQKSLIKKQSKLAYFEISHIDTIKQIHSKYPNIRIVMPIQLGYFEEKEKNKIEIYCKKNDIDYKFIWDWTLIEPSSIKRIPLSFSAFRKLYEKSLTVLSPTSTPDSIPTISHSFKSIPSAIDHSSKTNQCFQKGGEHAALNHMHDYIWNTQSISHYKQTRNKLMGNHVSSTFSGYISHGCVSIRTLYHDIKKFEKSVTKNESTYWLRFELLWRDFFQFQYINHANHWFKINGIQQNEIKEPNTNSELCHAWATGSTEHPFINATMKELSQTGYLSNRGRQNAASYLIHNLNQDWRFGAAVFEHFLIDHDVASNIGNWMYIAGVGNSKQKRIFNITHQQDRYDKQNDYTNYWTSQ